MVQAVKCDACGRLHEVTSTDYVSVAGNILRGESGGLVGNNLSNLKRGKQEVTSVSFFCYPGCIAKVLGIELVTTR